MGAAGWPARTAWLPPQPPPALELEALRLSLHDSHAARLELAQATLRREKEAALLELRTTLNGRHAQELALAQAALRRELALAREQHARQQEELAQRWGREAGRAALSAVPLRAVPRQAWASERDSCLESLRRELAAQHQAELQCLQEQLRAGAAEQSAQLERALQAKTQAESECCAVGVSPGLVSALWAARPPAGAGALQMLQAQQEDQLRGLRADLQAEHHQRVEELQAEHHQRVEELQAEHRQRVEELQAEHRQQVEELQAEHRQQVEELQAEHRQQVEELQAEHRLRVEELQPLERGHDRQRQQQPHPESTAELERPGVLVEEELGAAERSGQEDLRGSPGRPQEHTGCAGPPPGGVGYGPGGATPALCRLLLGLGWHGSAWGPRVPADALSPSREQLQDVPSTGGPEQLDLRPKPPSRLVRPEPRAAAPAPHAPAAVPLAWALGLPGEGCPGLAALHSRQRLTARMPGPLSVASPGPFPWLLASESLAQGLVQPGSPPCPPAALASPLDAVQQEPAVPGPSPERAWVAPEMAETPTEERRVQPWPRQAGLEAELGLSRVESGGLREEPLQESRQREPAERAPRSRPVLAGPCKRQVLLRCRRGAGAWLPVLLAALAPLCSGLLGAAPTAGPPGPPPRWPRSVQAAARCLCVWVAACSPTSGRRLGVLRGASVRPAAAAVPRAEHTALPRVCPQSRAPGGHAPPRLTDGRRFPQADRDLAGERWEEPKGAGAQVHAAGRGPGGPAAEWGAPGEALQRSAGGTWAPAPLELSACPGPGEPPAAGASELREARLRQLLAQQAAQILALEASLAEQQGRLRQLEQALPGEEAGCCGREPGGGWELPARCPEEEEDCVLPPARDRWVRSGCPLRCAGPRWTRELCCSHAPAGRLPSHQPSWGGAGTRCSAPEALGAHGAVVFLRLLDERAGAAEESSAERDAGLRGAELQAARDERRRALALLHAGLEAQAPAGGPARPAVMPRAPESPPPTAPPAADPQRRRTLGSPGPAVLRPLAPALAAQPHGPGPTPCHSGPLASAHQGRPAQAVDASGLSRRQSGCPGRAAELAWAPAPPRLPALLLGVRAVRQGNPTALFPLAVSPTAPLQTVGTCTGDAFLRCVVLAAPVGPPSLGSGVWAGPPCPRRCRWRPLPGLRGPRREPACAVLPAASLLVPYAWTPDPPSARPQLEEQVHALRAEAEAGRAELETLQQRRDRENQEGAHLLCLLRADLGQAHGERQALRGALRRLLSVFGETLTAAAALRTRIGARVGLCLDAEGPLAARPGGEASCAGEPRPAARGTGPELDEPWPGVEATLLELDRTLPGRAEECPEAELSSHIRDSFLLSPESTLGCEQPVRALYQSLGLAVDSLLEMALDSSRQLEEARQMHGRLEQALGCKSTETARQRGELLERLDAEAAERARLALELHKAEGEGAAAGPSGAGGRGQTLPRLGSRAPASGLSGPAARPLPPGIIEGFKEEQRGLQAALGRKEASEQGLALELERLRQQLGQAAQRQAELQLTEASEARGWARGPGGECVSLGTGGARAPWAALSLGSREPWGSRDIPAPWGAQLCPASGCGCFLAWGDAAVRAPGSESWRPPGSRCVGGCAQLGPGPEPRLRVLAGGAQDPFLTACCHTGSAPWPQHPARTTALAGPVARGRRRTPRVRAARWRVRWSSGGAAASVPTRETALPPGADASSQGPWLTAPRRPLPVPTGLQHTRSRWARRAASADRPGWRSGVRCQRTQRRGLALEGACAGLQGRAASAALSVQALLALRPRPVSGRLAWLAEGWRCPCALPLVPLLPRGCGLCCRPREGVPSCLPRTPALQREVQRLTREQAETRRQAEKDHSALRSQMQVLESELEEQLAQQQARAREAEELPALRQQLASLDKHLRGQRQFMDEQAAEREQEREEFQQEIRRLEERLRLAARPPPPDTPDPEVRGPQAGGGAARSAAAAHPRPLPSMCADSSRRGTRRQDSAGPGGEAAPHAAAAAQVELLREELREKSDGLSELALQVALAEQRARAQQEEIRRLEAADAHSRAALARLQEELEARRAAPRGLWQGQEALQEQRRDGLLAPALPSPPDASRGPAPPEGPEAQLEAVQRESEREILDLGAQLEAAQGRVVREDEEALCLGALPGAGPRAAPASPQGHVALRPSPWRSVWDAGATVPPAGPSTAPRAAAAPQHTAADAAARDRLSAVLFPSKCRD
ncbi:Pericentrin [Galemys pyrenaicus]|uniref:Pericentrin n=1 Tax=Galemys pyrenaicus TaxID=202257 RepID=A0A8J6DSD3_GALPY|nr:Pericentrin [Galemys pyrenaicus]